MRTYNSPKVTQLVNGEVKIVALCWARTSNFLQPILSFLPKAGYMSHFLWFFRVYAVTEQDVDAQPQRSIMDDQENTPYR